MKQHNTEILEEGLRRGDLEDTIYSVFEVDTFRSKMGEDQDVCVLTFQAKDRYPAKDFMEFIEKGYPFVLDADVSSGENENGEYSIFVEVERSSRLPEQIKEMLYGLSRLTGIDEWKFSYYKDKNKKEATTENLKVIPTSRNVYEVTLRRFRVEEMKSFFSKTLMDDLTIDGDVITFHKPFDVKVQLKLIQEGDNKILEGMQEAPALDENSTAEIFWLTKVMGDYGINKFGDKFVFNNGNKSLVLQRI